MKIFYSDHFPLPLPEGHRFPMEKYARLRGRAAQDPGMAAGLTAAPAAGDHEILRAHCPEYLRRVVEGTLSQHEVRRIGFPWSPQMAERSRRSSGATIEACRSALVEGVAASLAGGTHHAFRDRGEGFCVFNDSAIAIRAVQAERLAEKVMIVDCDVHQGNGSAAIFRGDLSVFTFSIHGARNFPFHKEASDLDVALDDFTGDADYLDALSIGLETALRSFQPDLAIYLAGADPFERDRLGRLSLTKNGLLERDRLVLDRLAGAAIPVAVTMGGGYAPDVEDIVDIHFQTLKGAAPLQFRVPGNRACRLDQQKNDSPRHPHPPAPALSGG